MADNNQTSKNIQNNQNHSHKNDNHSRASSQLMVNRVTGLVLIILVIAILFIYGFAGEIRLVKSDNLSQSQSAVLKTKLRQTSSFTSQLIFGQLYTITTFFVVLGFSFLLIYFKKATATGVFTVLFIVSLTILISPFIQKFWFNVFIHNFSTGDISNTNSPSRFIQSSIGGKDIYLDFYNLKISLANAISQLVVILIAYGKLSTIQIILQTIIFNVCWNLNHFLCIKLTTNSPDDRIFDDYQITNVYLFGGFYGWMLMNLMNINEKSIKSENSTTNHHASVMSYVGSCFLFLSFCGTTTLFATKYNLTQFYGQFQRAFIWQEAYISSFFALSASVIFTYAFSILFSQNSKIHFKNSLVGIISGGIIYGCVAGTCNNISAAIASGLLAGFFAGLAVKYEINISVDSLGGTLYRSISVIASFFIAPIIIIAYYNFESNISTLQTKNDSSLPKSIISNKQIAGWILAYVGISIAIGIISGLIVGILFRCIKSIRQRFFDDTEIFGRTKDFGLKELQTSDNQLAKMQSANQLMK